MDEYVLSIEYGNIMAHYTMSFVIGMGIFLAIVIAIFLVPWILRRHDNDKNAWVNATAVLTGKKNVYKDPVRAGNFYRVPTENVEYEIIYWAEGKRYVKWLTIVPSEEEGTEIPIEYYKKNPSRFREL